MSLFICMECGCVENTNCVNRNINTNPEYPNLHKMEMDGFIPNREERGEIRYLCSECNTGIWHDEFPKKLATDSERLIASFSKTNMITPADHPSGCITGGYDGYHVDERYLLFVDIFGRNINSDNNLLFRVYLEDRMNFSITCLEKLKNIKDNMGDLNEDDIKEAIRSYAIYKDRHDSKTYNGVILGYSGHSKKMLMAAMASYAAMSGLGLDMMDPRYESKPHWKEIQSEGDKDKALKKASLKREIKALKKQKPVNTSLLEQIQKEFKEL